MGPISYCSSICGAVAVCTMMIGTLAQITGLTKTAWSQARPVLAEFFQIHEGLWRHGRVERERIRVTAKQLSNSKQAKLAAARRWSKPELLLPGMTRAAML